MKFSILTCSYNNLEGVKAAVTALRSPAVSAGNPEEFPAGDCRSTGIDVEHIIIDGGSTDGTREWLRAQPLSVVGCQLSVPEEEGLKKKVDLKWISDPDQGLYDALNKGLKLATGDVIGILHTDDVWEEGVLTRVAEAFRREASLECGSVAKDERNFRFGGEEAKLRGGEADPVEAMLESPESGASQAQDRTPGASIDAVYGDLLYVDAADISKVKRVWRAGSYDKRKWYNGWMPPHPALFVTRELAERVGEYRLDLGSAADYEWMLRAALVHDAKLVHVNDVERERAQKQKGSARVFLTFFRLKFGSGKNVKNHGLTPFAFVTPFVRMRVGGQSNATAKARLKAHAADRRAWEVNGLKPKGWTLWMKPLRKLPQWIVKP